MESHPSHSASAGHDGTGGVFFDDPLFEQFAVRSMTLDGCPLGEISTIASSIEEGDADSWFQEWSAAGDRLGGYGDASAHADHAISASGSYLRAASYYRAAYAPLFGSPVDARLVEAFDKEAAAFQKAAALMPSPVEPVEIPFEGTTLPGYFCRVDDSDRPRPTLICTNGYDSTIYEMYLDFAAPALRRGYNLLLFDGPGQGRPLIRQGLKMRPDWENVVGPVVDYAITRQEVDPEKIALMGWSFGGYLAPRAASAEHRLAACIADPGLWDLLESMKASFTVLPKEVLEKFPDVDPEVLKPLEEHIRAIPALRWAVVQRAFWVHGIDSLAEYVHISQYYSLKEAAGRIRCPTLLTLAESDPLSWNAERIHESLRCPRELVRFTNAEGAGDHCEGKARPLFHRRAFDWLDETLEVSPER
ncbi:MAG TPA: alpha/beta fold hydrolase [Rubrobacter sp.]|nr:alpha/beta fold hydrolase [Rubrobacter sp.]